jgi:hypothetical protein
MASIPTRKYQNIAHARDALAITIPYSPVEDWQSARRTRRFSPARCPASLPAGAEGQELARGNNRPWLKAVRPFKTSLAPE